MILQPQHLTTAPLSGLFLGAMFAGMYAGAVGWTWAAWIGATVGIGMFLAMLWLGHRGDGAARHVVVGACVYALMGMHMLGGTAVFAVTMATKSSGVAMSSVPWVGWVAWLIGALTALTPLIGAAWIVRSRLKREGFAGAWARRAISLRSGTVEIDGADDTDHRVAVSPWLIGALGVNVGAGLQWMGGQGLALMAGFVLMIVGFTWAGVGQLGPRLGRAWFVLEAEAQTSQRLQSLQWEGMQAMRRGHWLGRWLMKKEAWPR